jgi:hypothetical protein
MHPAMVGTVVVGDGTGTSDGVRAQLSAESWLRLGLVALLGGAGFVAAMRPAFRRS